MVEEAEVVVASAEVAAVASAVVEEAEAVVASAEVEEEPQEAVAEAAVEVLEEEVALALVSRSLSSLTFVSRESTSAEAKMMCF